MIVSGYNDTISVMLNLKDNSIFPNLSPSIDESLYPTMYIDRHDHYTHQHILSGGNLSQCVLYTVKEGIPDRMDRISGYYANMPIYPFVIERIDPAIPLGMKVQTLKPINGLMPFMLFDRSTAMNAIVNNDQELADNLNAQDIGSRLHSNDGHYSLDPDTLMVYAESGELLGRAQTYTATDSNELQSFNILRTNDRDAINYSDFGAHSELNTEMTVSGIDITAQLEAFDIDMDAMIDTALQDRRAEEDAMGADQNGAANS